jgi:uncharacterized protein (DUF1800 family)
VLSDRALIARYFHRFGLGPKPGEFSAAVKNGVASVLTNLFQNSGNTDAVYPAMEFLGPRPDNAIARAEWTLKMREQRNQLVIWWVDQMASTSFPLTERMVWFWHGHWATSMEKVDYANAMLIQNRIFREFGLKNFDLLSQRMIMDSALQYWLDNNTNTIKAPNENLARELMELFVLGVNRYTESDIKEVARALTGYSLNRENGEVIFNKNRHDNGILNILGVSAQFDAQSLTKMLVARDDCAKFISERLWYRFISDEKNVPDNSIAVAFKDREIIPAIQAIATHSEMKSESNIYVKQPLEWFVSACRALNVVPSSIAKREVILNYLEKIAQKPFYPPNVGGWPSGEIWLTAANAQYRIELAQLIVKVADLNEINSARLANRHLILADILGVGEWSSRTKSALIANRQTPELAVVTALCAPEYLVSI